MVKYLLKGADPATYYTQTNNPLEQELGKTGANRRLESCGPTSAVMLLAACGLNTAIICPGAYKPQPEEVLADFFNDPANYADLKADRSDVNPEAVMGNEIPQWYPVAINAVFGVACFFSWGIDWNLIKNAIDHNVGLMVCTVNPGHFLAIVGYDDVTNEVIYNDPWPANRWPTGGDNGPGFNRRVSYDKLKENLAGYRIGVNASAA